MKHQLLTILLALCLPFGGWGGQTAQAEIITKTYLFSGGTAGNSTTFQGYFYEEGTTNANYNCFPNPWTYGSTASIHATLKDGITINIASSKSQIFVQNGLAVAGEVTVTVGGGTNNYYIWHVTLYSSAAQPAIDEDNWGADVECTHTFSKTVSAGYFYKLVVTYSTDDIYLINESSTTITGVDDEYAYTGSEVEPEPVVVCNGRTLTRGTHYDVNYSGNKAPGTARVTVSGIPPFHGYVTKDYTIYDPAMVPLEWVAGSTVEVTEDNAVLSPISVTGTGNLTLRIASGATLMAKYGITIADGATLTVEGPGTLTVTNDTGGTKGAGGDDGGGTGDIGGPGVAGVGGSLVVNGGTVNITGGTGGSGGTGGTVGKDGVCGNGGIGGIGGAGVGGSLVVNDGTVNITGGTGGTGGSGGTGPRHTKGGSGGTGGTGGTSVSGLLTVNGGTVNITGGTGGNGGSGGGPRESMGASGSGGKGGVGTGDLLTVNGGTVNVEGGSGSNPRSGSPGDALGSTVTCTTATHVIQERYGGGNWSNLASGSTSTKQYVRVLPLTPLTLYDDADNTAAIAEAAADGLPRTVILNGRKLYRDGAWNTLCLPFDMSAGQVTAQLAPAGLMTLSASSLTGGTLTLTFADATTIEAGKPYIIRWNGQAVGGGIGGNSGNVTNPYNTGSVDGQGNIIDPVFTGITVKSGTTDTATDYVSFVGTYDPTNIYASPATNLYLGAANTLYWPSTEGYEIGPFRAYFQLKNGLTCGDPTTGVRAFNLNFGDEEATGIKPPSPLKGEQLSTPPSGGRGAYWYTLDGVKLDGVGAGPVPARLRKGLYIHGGRKVVIK